MRLGSVTSVVDADSFSTVGGSGLYMKMEGERYSIDESMGEASSS